MKTKKDIASSQKRNQSDLRLRIGLFIALHILFAFSSTLNSIDRIEEEHNFEAHYQKSKTTLEGIEGFGDPTFNRIIDIHDQYLSEFGKWRGLFSRYAGELAKLVKTFPGSQRLSEDELRQNFSDPYSNYGNFASNGVFEPWTNRWSGKWSNGKMQYHIWDTTQFFNARMVQAVTLSESRFVHIDKAGKIAQSGKADIAVNILSAEAGITGWVSKYQSGRLELPHIGYSINETTLIWICQMKSPNKLFERDSLWFIFLETVNITAEPKEYHIYGLPIVITNRFIAQTERRGQHQGVYYSAATAFSGLPRQKIEGGRDGT